jgi:hypothetical protein
MNERVKMIVICSRWCLPKIEKADVNFQIDNGVKNMDNHNCRYLGTMIEPEHSTALHVIRSPISSLTDKPVTIAACCVPPLLSFYNPFYLGIDKKFIFLRKEQVT